MLRYRRTHRCTEPQVNPSEELAARDALLHHHPGDGDHGKAAIVELLRLHLGELGGGRRLEAERVPAVVTGNMVRLDCPALDVGVLKCREDGEHLDDRNDEHDAWPEVSFHINQYTYSTPLVDE